MSQHPFTHTQNKSLDMGKMMDWAISQILKADRWIKRSKQIEIKCI